MTPGSHLRSASEETPPAPEPARTRRRWRIGTPLVFLLCGALFVVSAENSDGTDLRPGRYTDLASLVSKEAEQVEAVKDRVADLNTEVASLTEAVNDRDVNRYRRQIETLSDPAGLEPRTGEGVTITLSDAPEDVINSSTRDINLLVVHQQDIQAVVNALWKGGAAAVTIQGQRVVSTTGIKCEGNAVQLQGVPYSQPYEISGVGKADELLDAVAADEYLQIYRDQAAEPDVAVGWDVTTQESLTAPAYTGLLDLQYAQPMR